jgi:excisionase family DNA binding protein
MGSQNLQLPANAQEGWALTSHRIALTPPDPKFFATRLLRRGGGLNLPENELLRVAEVARLLRLCRATIYRLVERGELPALRIGNSIRFHPEDVSNTFTSFQRKG